jgi:hypothetical protein
LDSTPVGSGMGEAGSSVGEAGSGAASQSTFQAMCKAAWQWQPGWLFLRYTASSAIQLGPCSSPTSAQAGCCVALARNTEPRGTPASGVSCT